MNPALLLENLAAIPSYHYEPVFAQQVRRAFEEFRPTAVALECRDYLRDELDWALSCWPTPVVSEAPPRLYPFVPGDSILEAYRLARERGIDVHLVDLAVADPIQRPSGQLPGPEFAPRVGPLFLEAVDSLLGAAGPAAEGDVAREAHMAGRLAELMRQCERVLWVGGAAHWPALRMRIAEKDFTAPRVRTFRPGSFVRMRLTSSALHYLTGRVPYLVNRYAKAPDSYEVGEAVRSLALEAVAPESFPARDVSRVLVYARNLVAIPELREQPSLWELVTAATGVLGERYAARLFLLAVQEEISEKARDLPVLTHEVEDGREGLRCGSRWVKSMPWPRRDGRRRIWLRIPPEKELIRRVRGNPWDDPGTGEGDEWYDVFPPDLAEYEAFVQLLLRKAAATVPGESEARPFGFGLRDGIDVRATLRHWHEGTLFVREPTRERVRITNAVIDFEGRTESSAFLRGEHPPATEAERDPHLFWPASDAGAIAPWTDSDHLRIGSISRLCRVNETLRDRPLVQRLHRGLSLVTLDAANDAPGEPTDGFVNRVIIPLVDLAALQTEMRDDLESWLRIFFAFARGKPVAYFSRYVPGPKIQAVAQQHGVRVVHEPLSRIPAELRRRNRTFRIMSLTGGQWEVLRRRIAEAKGARPVGWGG